MMRLTLQLIVVLSSASVFADDSTNLRPAEYDRFNYDTTVREADHNDYGPEDWIRIRCPDTKTCLGWPDSFDEGVGWSFPENSCRWCPQGLGCGTHHQSPINVRRDVVFETDPLYNMCIDGHWMKYFDSTCTWDELVRTNSFSIERHALKVAQPTEKMADGTFRIGCQSELGRSWGKIDFAKGFSDWWHLSHIDLHVPSEHTQNGKRYDGELQMYHFYSVTGEQAGVNNEMGTVTVFLQAYDKSPDYGTLNRVICQWRKVEDQTRAACGLPSVLSEYPGCRRYTRGRGVSTSSGRPPRNLSESNNTTLAQKPMSAHDILMHNYLHPEDIQPILMSEDDYKDEDDFDWAGFIESQYENDRQVQNRRHLLNYDHVGTWHNYWPLIDSRTEYYYRYGGTQTVPPCYGRFVLGNNRAQTNNWRVMKDPIRISKRQLNELHRLLRERIAPPNDPLVACQADTAAKVDQTTGFVDVARPLQENDKAHHMVYCECENWGSKWQEDKDYCRIFRDDKNARFFKHPYNFKTDGF